jgi:hypothetical protein
MYARIWQMSESRFEADRTRKSFSDLPGEIRNMVYGLALFDEPEGNYASARLWPITLVFRADGHYLQPKRTRAYQKCSSLQELRHDRTLSTMGMLAALNKQTRHEIRTFFWSRISVTIAVQSAQAVPPPMYFRYLIKFLKEIGRDGRAALSDLRATNMSLKYESASPRYWQSLTKSLRQCLNLCELELCLSVDVLFGHATDHNALRTYFLHGKALNSPSLAGLFTFFQGFPRLRVLKLHTAPDRPGRPWLSDRRATTSSILRSQVIARSVSYKRYATSSRICREYRSKSSAAVSMSMTLRSGRSGNRAVRLRFSELSRSWYQVQSWACGTNCVGAWRERALSDHPP